MTRLAIRAPRAWLGPGRVLDDAEVVVEGDAIAWVGPTGSGGPVDEGIVLDGFLLPAGADRHVHLELSDPWMVLRGGVTAVRDLAWPADRILPLAELSESPAFDGPLVRAAGPMLTAPGGYPTAAAWAPPGTGLEVADASAAAAAVDDLVRRGAAAIKVSLNAEEGPTPEDGVLVAIAEAAGAHDVPVTAHAQGAGQVERALGAGFAELAHTPWAPLADDVVRRCADAIRIVSTLDILGFGRSTPEQRMAIGNLDRFLAAGGEVVYGTDLGNGPIPPGIHVRELELLQGAGLDPDGVLQALVRAPIEPGAPADLIAVAGDPLEDLGALGRLVAVFRAGRRVV